MKLWLLRPVGYDPRNPFRNPTLTPHNPWSPWYDKAFGFVVRAWDEASARELAAVEAGDEKAIAWLDETLSTCEELLPDGDAVIIVQDLASA